MECLHLVSSDGICKRKLITMLLDRAAKKFSFVLLLAEASAEGKKNTVLFSSNVCENTFLKGFCSDLYLRPSCHKCPSRDFKSGSDIIIADFWGQEYMFPEFDNDTGVSSVIVKTEKGRHLLSILKNPIIERKNIDQVLLYNPSLVFSKPTPPLTESQILEYAIKYDI